MAALGLALFTTSSPATGTPCPPPGSTTSLRSPHGRQAGPLAAQSAAPSAASPK
jgi:hypothetical protein